MAVHQLVAEMCCDSELHVYVCTYIIFVDINMHIEVSNNVL